MSDSGGDDQTDPTDGQRFDEPFASLRADYEKPTHPVPNWVWVILAFLMSATLFLAIRLAVIRTDEPSSRVTARTLPTPTLAIAPRSAPAPPPSSREALTALAEGWRLAWQSKDLTAYLGYYARTFGSNGKDRTTWAAQKGRTFAGDQTVEVSLSDVETTVYDAIVVITFVQDYRSGAFRDRGRKRLYLLAEDGAWRIFNEDWEPLE